MSTRSTTTVIDGHDNTVVATFYRQSDGYPSGHGQDLVDFLKGGTVTNGIGFGSTGRTFNGAGDLAFRLIASMKDDPSVPGNFYCIPAALDWDAAYDYTIWAAADQPILVTCSTRGWGEHPDEAIFRGTVEEFEVWVKENPDG